MSRQLVIKCEVCELETGGPTNDWFIVTKDFGAALLDVCGAYCLVKMLNIWINTPLMDQYPFTVQRPKPYENPPVSG